jgi:hypothetical protein
VISQALASTTRLSAFVIFILLGARMFSLTFYGVNGHVWVEHLLVSLPGGETGFPDLRFDPGVLPGLLPGFLRARLHHRPALVAPAEALGIDLIWFGVILAVNMQTSFMHPPFGFALFYLRSVAPRKAPYVDKVTGERLAGVSTGQIYWGAVPFVVIQVVMIGLTIAFPSMVMHYKGTVVDPSTIEIKVPTLAPLAPGGADSTLAGRPHPWRTGSGCTDRGGNPGPRPARSAAWRAGDHPVRRQKAPEFPPGPFFVRLRDQSLPACCCAIMKTS